MRQIKVLIKLFQKFAVGKAEPYGLTRRSRRKNAADGAHAAKQIAPGAVAEAPCLSFPQSIAPGAGAEAPCFEPPLSITNKKDTQAFGLDVLFSFPE